MHAHLFKSESESEHNLFMWSFSRFSVLFGVLLFYVFVFAILLFALFGWTCLRLVFCSFPNHVPHKYTHRPWVVIFIQPIFIEISLGCLQNTQNNRSRTVHKFIWYKVKNRKEQKRDKQRESNKKKDYVRV